MLKIRQDKMWRRAGTARDENPEEAEPDTATGASVHMGSLRMCNVLHIIIFGMLLEI